VFSVSAAELMTIAVIALLVFGPKRLPEIARKAGKMLRSAREAADEIRSDLESEYGDTLEPLREARDDVRRAIGGADRPPPSRTRPPAEGSDDGSEGAGG
jgi:sec-independent protein translocase protein TatB